jgi:hypothetical protein
MTGSSVPPLGKERVLEQTVLDMSGVGWTDGRTKGEIIGQLGGVMEMGRG